MRDDAHAAWRHLRARPLLAVAVVLLSALGLGVCTAAVSVIDSLIVRPLPFQNSEQLVRIQTTRGFTMDVLAAWRQSGVFLAVEQYSLGRQLRIDLRGGGIDVRAWSVSPGLLRLLGVRPILGRLFETGDGLQGTTDRILLAEVLWRNRFGGDPNVMGRTIVVNGRESRVVGVVPASFQFPDTATSVWTPIDDRNPDSRVGLVVAAVAPGVPHADAEAVAQALTREAGVIPSPSSFEPRFVPLLPTLDRWSRGAVLVGSAAVGLLFIAICANAGGLVLVDLNRRRAELGVCAALGATRARFMRPIILEHVLLGGIALCLGLSIASLLLSGVPILLPETVRSVSLNPIDLDVTAFVAAGVLTMGTIVLAGAVPAWSGR